MLRCDFCGREVQAVTRVVLDEGYDRLTLRHSRKYACPECSEKKELARKKKERPADKK